MGRITVIFFVISFIALTNAYTRLYEYGSPTPNQVLLGSHNIKKSAGFLFKTSGTYKFPQYGVYNMPISYIRITSQARKSKAKISRYGIGQNKVELKLKAKRGRNLNFLVEIYGTPINNPQYNYYHPPPAPVFPPAKYYNPAPYYNTTGYGWNAYNNMG